MTYRPEIDGLRAIAVLAVVLDHAGLPGVPGGFAGVDIFFVLSGYLITLRLLAARQQRGPVFLPFYLRRARRLLPALAVVLAATLVMGWVFMTPLGYRELCQAVLATLFFASNFYMARETGYFAPDADLIPLLHTWSLAVEE